jgi:hypothetical protein
MAKVARYGGKMHGEDLYLWGSFNLFIAKADSSQILAETDSNPRSLEIKSIGDRTRFGFGSGGLRLRQFPYPGRGSGDGQVKAGLLSGVRSGSQLGWVRPG